MLMASCLLYQQTELVSEMLAHVNSIDKKIQFTSEGGGTCYFISRCYHEMC